MRKWQVSSMIAIAFYIAALVLLLNPQIMESMSDIAMKSILIFLRALDDLAVKYQLVRGNIIWINKEDINGFTEKGYRPNGRGTERDRRATDNGTANTRPADNETASRGDESSTGD